MNEPHDIEALRSEAKLKAENDQRTDVADLRWLMGQKRGRRMVWRRLERAGVFRTSFNTNSMTMAFNEGRRNEGVALLAEIHTHCPDLYSVMTKEQSGE